MHKVGKSGEFLGRLLGPLLKIGLPLKKNVFKPLTKSVLITLWLAAADAAIRKKVFGSGRRSSYLASHVTILIISNEEMNDIIKIVKSLEESGLFRKGVSETIKNEAKEQKGGFLRMLLGTLGASLWGILLTDKDTIRADEVTMKASEGTIRAGEGTIRSGEDTIRVGQDFECRLIFNKFWNTKILSKWT